MLSCYVKCIGPSKHPWRLRIHRPKNGGGCVHEEALVCIMHEHVK